MNIYQNILKASQIRKISIKEAEKIAKIGPNSCQNWIDHSPTVGKLWEIAKVYNTTLEFLLGETEDINAKVGEAHGLTKQEERLLIAFRNLNKNGQKRILGDAEEFVSSERYKKDESASVTA